jgi:hypothetical protein
MVSSLKKQLGTRDAESIAQARGTLQRALEPISGWGEFQDERREQRRNQQEAELKKLVETATVQSYFIQNYVKLHMLSGEVQILLGLNEELTKALVLKSRDNLVMVTQNCESEFTRLRVNQAYLDFKGKRELPLTEKNRWLVQGGLRRDLDIGE